MSIEIIFEDKHLLALNKPAHIHSTLSKKNNEPSVAAWLAKKYPQLSKVSKSRDDVGLVNRLDFETSGVIVAAKSKSVWEKMHDMLKSDNATKQYLCVVEGGLEEPTLVENYLGSPNRRAKTMRVFKNKPDKKFRAQLARTQFSTLVISTDLTLSLLQVNLYSGRRHQIRAHAKYLNCPLLGDSLYGAKLNTSGVFPGIENLPKLILHCELLAFSHPITKENIGLCAPFPDYIKQIITTTFSR